MKNKNIKNNKWKDENKNKNKESFKNNNIHNIFGIVTQKLGIDNSEIGFLYNVQVSSEFISEGNIRNEINDNYDNNKRELIESYVERSCLNLYFVNKHGVTFKSPFFFRPYFYIEVHKKVDIQWASTNLEHKYRDLRVEFEYVKKEDLLLENHLIGEKRELIKISFDNVKQLVNIRNEIMAHMKKNKNKIELNTEYEKFNDVLDSICEIYEYDVQYETRVLIDNSISIGMWYKFIRWSNELLELKCLDDDTTAPDLRSLAWDIETTKDPLKFPNVEKDQIMMISCVFEGQGYLITNREVVSEDINDFEYSPKKEFQSFFNCINCSTEEELIKCYVSLVQDLKPHIISSYNGDNFDFPFLYNRAKKYDINITSEWGIKMGIDHSSGFGLNQSKTVFSGTNIIHFDCFRWVERDSYLPCGSRSLKSVTKAKLRYNPVELDPELMVPYASNNPQGLAEYSVSDAVATYYLYKTYVHRFIFALATIIPLSGEDLLRRGSGTLCEHLLMKEAFNKNILFPNKKIQESIEYYQNKPILNSTYVGGTVESLCSGIFRADIPEDFNLNINIIQNLIENIDSTLKFGIEDSGNTLESVINYQEVKENILNKLRNIIETPRIKIEPLIYHLDVAAMYPNIILTNRLQPTAIIDEKTCMRCPFYSEANICQRKMNWRWKGDVFPISKGEMDRMIKHLELETFENIKSDSNEVSDKNKIDNEEYNSDYEKDGNEELIDIQQVDIHNNLGNKDKYSKKNQKDKIKWISLTPKQQSEILIQRMKTYCNKIYRKQTENIEETRSSIVCQRENPFYIDTVRRFRDRRYLYKDKKKEAEEEIRKAEANNDLLLIQEAQNKELLYESLQLAHKCILNSFYGYVMRKGSRWFSMEMAAIVTWLGGNIIKEARSLIEGIGRPLELDTDGIWAIIPSGFPENITFEFKNGKKKKLNYICTLLNQQVHKNWTNYQYLEYDSNKHKYNVKVENSIYFEVDGPYKCFFIPASDKQDKLLKKRYAVFDFENKLRELKGFELKRRGELQLIKILQEELFPAFLLGNTKKEAYESVANISRKWLNLIDTKGKGILDDEQLFFLISESKNMSKSVKQLGNAKSMSITTARRLFEFLQNPSYILDKNIVCKFIVSEFPKGEEKSQRAIPLSIFSTPLETRISWLSKWLGISKNKNDKKDNTENSKFLNDDSYKWNVRNILDWDYYKKRLTNTILKIVVIPAINQGLSNPLPELEVPNWVKYHAELIGTNQQKISQYFTLNKTNKRIHETNNEKLISDKENNTNNINVTIIKENSNFNNENKVCKNLTKKERFDLFKEKGIKSWIEYQKKIWLEKFLITQEKQLEFENKIKNMDKDKLSYFGKGDFTQGLRFISEYEFLTRTKFYILDVFPAYSESLGSNENNGFYNLVIYSELTGSCYIVMFKFLRRFYIATKNSIQIIDDGDHEEEFSFKPIVTGKELPRGVNYDYLTEVTISEKKFQESKSTLICDNNIVGIYETNIPLEFSILEKFGNMFETTTPNIDKIILNDGSISDKYWNICNSNKIISNYGDLIHWLILSICYLEDRMCFSLSDLSKGIIFIYLSSGPVISTNLLISELKKQLEIFNLTNFQQFIVKYYKTSSESLEEINNNIKNIKQEFSTQPIVLLINSTLNYEDLQSINSNISFYKHSFREKNYFPNNMKKVINADILTLWQNMNTYNLDIDLTKFNWYKDSILFSITLLKENLNKLQLTLELSKVTRLPVLYLLQFKYNLTNFLYDIIYSRELHSMGILSWASLDSVPDLGNPRFIELSKSDWDLKRIQNYLINDNSNDEILEIVKPGIYRGYAAQLEFKQWLIIESVRNCIQVSERHNLDDFQQNEKKILGAENKKRKVENLNSSKKDSLLYKFGKKEYIAQKEENFLSAPLYNHSSASTSSALLCLQKTINKLRTIVEKTEVSSIFNKYNNIDLENENKKVSLLVEFIIALQNNFYSWLSSPESLLFDPALIEATKEYASKYFKSLESDMKELGIKIIYGNIRKMIVTIEIDELNNNIKNIVDLKEHFNQMMQILNNRDIYSGISLTPTIEYKALIQLDRTNYLRRTFDSEEPYDINLNLLSFFPFNSRKFILDEISNFLMDPLRILRKYMKKSSNLNLKEYNQILYDIVLEQFGPYSDNFQNFLQAISNSNYILNKYGIDYFLDPLNNINYENSIEDNNLIQIENLNENNKLENELPFAIYPNSKNLKKKYNFTNKKINKKNELFEFPVFIGKKNDVGKKLNVELARLFLYIWGLDKSFNINKSKQDQFEQLKFMVCQTIDISEFDPIITSKWKTPFYSYIIKDFKCPNCLEIDDFDFIANIIQDDLEGEIRNSYFNEISWYCIHCNISIDCRLLEEKLLIEFFERLEVIQSQDILCINCKSIQIGNLRNYCQNCMGDLTTRLENNNCFKDFFFLFNSVADYYYEYNQQNQKKSFEALVQIRTMYKNVFYM